MPEGCWPVAYEAPGVNCPLPSLEKIVTVLTAADTTARPGLPLPAKSPWTMAFGVPATGVALGVSATPRLGCVTGSAIAFDVVESVTPGLDTDTTSVAPPFRNTPEKSATIRDPFWMTEVLNGWTMTRPGSVRFTTALG